VTRRTCVSGGGEKEWAVGEGEDGSASEKRKQKAQVKIRT